MSNFRLKTSLLPSKEEIPSTLTNETSLLMTSISENGQGIKIQSHFPSAEQSMERAKKATTNLSSLQMSMFKNRSSLSKSKKEVSSTKSNIQDQKSTKPFNGSQSLNVSSIMSDKLSKMSSKDDDEVSDVPNNSSEMTIQDLDDHSNDPLNESLLMPGKSVNESINYGPASPVKQRLRVLIDQSKKKEDRVSPPQSESLSETSEFGSWSRDASALMSSLYDKYSYQKSSRIHLQKELETAKSSIRDLQHENEKLRDIIRKFKHRESQMLSQYKIVKKHYPSFDD
mmetsp:Transcript_3174/g.4688  ORF Transcript_3174/g.4688 Transcript_3174/m.4688 type:complete len:284 (+) Transcript_3174:2242-3093(+)